MVDAEAIAVAYCFNPYNDTRPFPDGFIRTSHFVRRRRRPRRLLRLIKTPQRETPDYVQISGTFDWTKMNINPYDCGGEVRDPGVWARARMLTPLCATVRQPRRGGSRVSVAGPRLEHIA